MFELFESHEIEEMFDRPNRSGRVLKYDWYNMKRGMSFAIPCSSIKSKHYRPSIPDILVEEGFDISVSKRPLKENGDLYFVVTRTE